MTINRQIKISVVFLGHNETENDTEHQITRHIRFGLPAFAIWKLATRISYMPKHCPKFRTHIIKSKKSVSHER